MQARIPVQTPRLPMRSPRPMHTRSAAQRGYPMQSLVLVLVLCVSCRDCQAIRVPVSWDDETNSEVSESQVEKFTPTTLQQTIPKEYFEYKAHKPQFAVDVAAFHGVKDPENHYKAYPIRPYTGKSKPELGKHHMLDEDKTIYRPYQQYVNGNEEWQTHIIPTASSYEVFHPYKAEEPALQELYKDPILDKIRNDLKNSKENLQKYEKDAGEPDIDEGEYLESPEQTDRKKFPQRNVPATFEIHKPLRRPAYYRPPPRAFTHEQILNHKFRHPWNQNFVKVRPLHYRPLKSHLHNLRQHHSLKYDDEHNEYPQVPPSENFAEPPDGYDIYLNGQAKYNKLRNNIDESVNRAILKNRPAAYQKLEIQNQDTKEESDENEFVPIKSYAQVRKTETTKHLPKSAALEDAVSYDDIVNAHRLREAVKSTKAQTVYSEEGYEDAAYDHAGEQKHASDHEGHGGLLKEKEISGGKYKTPSFNGKYQDATGSIYRNKKHHGNKWKNDDKNNEKQNDSEDYTEDEFEHSEEEDAYGNVPDDDIRHKREHDTKNDQDNDGTDETFSHTESDRELISNDDNNATINEEPRQKRENVPETDAERTGNVTEFDHDVSKREANFEIPEFDFNSTFLTEKELNKIAKLKLAKTKKSNLRDKYPYYFNPVKSIHRDSPLRYAENLKLIPLKSKGGTEFYDSRSDIECSEVEDDVDPVPEKIKNNGTKSSDNEDNDDEDEDSLKGDKQQFDDQKKKQRLKGLGDKIDCFKAKYFGKNPLDSPFFKEDIIAAPKPIKTPKLETFKLNNFKKISLPTFKGENLATLASIMSLKDELSNGTSLLQDSISKATEDIKSSLFLPKNNTLLSETQKNVYGDIIANIKNNFQDPFVKDIKNKIAGHLSNSTPGTVNNNETIIKDNVNTAGSEVKKPIIMRSKRAAPFIYEPYKIIRVGQELESKKTTTTGNISPLIKQLQSSKVVEKVLGFNHDKDQPVKRNVKSRTYKDINRKDRDQNIKKDDPTFIDTNTDHRRGEPRYEISPANHKSQYTPVNHKKAMSVEDYESQTNTTIAPSRYSKALKRVFDEPRYYQQPSLESAASKTVRRVVSTTSSPKDLKSKSKEPDKPAESDEEYEDYEDDEEDGTTTTTTIKPSFKRRTRPTTTTIKPSNDYEDVEEETPELPKLRLITRFHKPYQTEKPIIKEEPVKKKHSETDKDDDSNAPKYREKKKKTRKSTLVTDTQRYGNDDESDMRKDEVDALIGVKQNMEDYMPNYEKEADSVMDQIKKQVPESSEEDEDDDDDEEDDDEEDEDDEDDDDDEGDDDEDVNDDEDEPSETDEVVASDENEKSKTERKLEPVILTTPEPTKRSVVRTTEPPPSTTEARSAKLDVKPVIHKKKVEIHKELPVNTSAPHVTQFKQDIQEVEIIKEMPQKRRKPSKNLEALELFKDDKLAEEINKLKDVEVFRENLDLRQGPKHGGNYRSAEIKAAPIGSSTPIPTRRRGLSKHNKPEKTQVEVDIGSEKDIEVKRKHGGHIKSRPDQRPKDNEASNAKHIELSDVDHPPRALHGGNLKAIQDKYKPRENSRNAKLVELDDDYESDDDSREMHGGNFKSYGNSRTGSGLHGGNYRSAKLVQAEAPKDDAEKKDKETLQARSRHVKSGRNTAAAILNGFAKAVPILTTTPNYILDPSKRMYYYVDT